MDLLTQQDRNAIRSAIADVMETFSVTPVTFFMPTETTSRWGNKDKPSFQEVVLNAVSLSTEITTYYAKVSENGVRESFDIDCKFDFDKAVAAGICATPNTVNIKAGYKFRVEGKEYWVTDYRTDGNFERRPLVFTVIGLQVNKTDNAPT